LAGKSERDLFAEMLLVALLASLAPGGLGHVPFHHGPPLLHHPYHLVATPICKLEFEKVTKEFCHITPKRVCETKTHEYKVVTGHEKEDCK